MLDRRAFLQQATLFGLMTPSLAAADPEKQSVFPIIDTHQHLWDLRRFRLPWLKGAGKLNRSFVMKDYLKAAAEVEHPLRRPGLPPARIVRTVYMEVDLAPEQQQAEAEFVIETCRGGATPMVAGVISGRPAAANFAKYIRPFKGSRYIKGIRQVLHGDAPPGYCLGKRFVTGIQLLGGLGLSFDLCLRSVELSDGAKLADACPGTQFILDHCGNPDVQARDRTQWKRDMEQIARRRNVVCKVSGIIASAQPKRWTLDDLAPIVNHTLDAFGPERVMFAGDWPVCTRTATLAQWVKALRTIVRHRKAEHQRKLFHDNAMRIYGLPA